MDHYLLPLSYNPCSVRLVREFFTCQKCGKCCHYDKVDIFEEDVKRLERYGLPREYVLSFITFDGERAHLISTGGCPFLNEKNECEVYEARPDTCWRYPIQYPKDGRIVVRGECQAAKDALQALQESEGWPITPPDTRSTPSQNIEATASSSRG